MKFSTKGRYAIRMMLDLAMQPTDTFTPLRDIAERQNISIKYLEQITAMLHKAGLVQSSRGNAGGYRLVMPPEQYTLGAILRVTEGSLTPVSCLETGQCENADGCLTRHFWHGLHQQISNYVDHYTLADLIAGASPEEQAQQFSEV